MNSTAKVSAVSSGRPSKRLLFDRRYGLVIDEYRDPSEEALAGGRGTFCIVPLAKAMFKMASHVINIAGSATIKILERPDLLSPQTMQASLDDQLHKFMSTVQKPKLNLFASKGNSSLQPTCDSSNLHTES